jgi:hypothetical protein
VVAGDGQAQVVLADPRGASQKHPSDDEDGQGYGTGAVAVRAVL